MYRVKLNPKENKWMTYTHMNGGHTLDFHNGIAETSDMVLIDEFRRFPNLYEIEKIDQHRSDNE